MANDTQTRRRRRRSEASRATHGCGYNQRRLTTFYKDDASTTYAAVGKGVHWLAPVTPSRLRQ